jgi:hypothetical protein
MKSQSSGVAGMFLGILCVLVGGCAHPSRSVDPPKAIRVYHIRAYCCLATAGEEASLRTVLVAMKAVPNWAMYGTDIHQFPIIPLEELPSTKTGEGVAQHLGVSAKLIARTEQSATIWVRIFHENPQPRFDAEGQVDLQLCQDFQDFDTLTTNLCDTVEALGALPHELHPGCKGAWIDVLPRHIEPDLVAEDQRE